MMPSPARGASIPLLPNRTQPAPRRRDPTRRSHRCAALPLVRAAFPGVAVRAWVEPGVCVTSVLKYLSLKNTRAAPSATSALEY